ncbi:unnamed protein product [Albugo candida]|uniref:Mediator of RNA polymerase II transcription subunit 20 n=2 Tax=Albugo candida TaxID=65357 RepID=A0A024GTU2_9STRA|nr:unnamed protein product [Albugo candida]|eukprot:CCI49971.1 unnamed protein product [Albugo candida]
MEMTGCTRVLIIQESHTTQKYQELVERLKHIGGQKLGRHVVHCRFFNRKLLTEGYTNQRMYMLRMSQNEELVYAVLVNERARNLGGSMNGAEQSTEQRMLLEYGLEGANILQQSEIYASKLDGQFEGVRYAVGDFNVSICAFMSRNNIPRGIVVEIQYSPCYEFPAVETLFDEFIQMLAPNTTIRKPINNLTAYYQSVGLSSVYSLKHTALQYVEAFNILRKLDK